MSVIIRLQNLPWSANALDIRNFFRGLSIPEGGVHIVGGELGDAFIAFSTDEDARQAMMLDGGLLKEIQVKLLLSSRSEMHKVIEAARQSVPILTLTAPAPAPAPPAPPTPTPVPAPTRPPVTVTPTITPFSAALGGNPLANFGIPGIGNPNEIPQPAVIEAPPLDVSPADAAAASEQEKEDDKTDKRRERDRRRSKSRSRSRDRDRRDRKRDRRDRSRSRDRRRRDRSRSRDRDRRDRKRDRKERSRSRDRSPSRRSRDRRNNDRKSPTSQDRSMDVQMVEPPQAPPAPSFNSINAPIPLQLQQMMQNNANNGPMNPDHLPSRFIDPTAPSMNDMNDTLSKLQELGKKRNPNAFQGDRNGADRFPVGRGGIQGSRAGAGARRESRFSRFEVDQQRDCCVAIRNAPHATTYGDVRKFFPYMIDKHGIKMINDNATGCRTGNIFVRFVEPRSKHISLQRKNNVLNDEVVSIEPLDDELFEAAVDSFMPFRKDNGKGDPNIAAVIENEPPPKPFNMLKLTDLPNFVKEHDIVKAFSEFSLLSIMLNDCRATRSKMAYVQFVKPEDAKTAFDKKDKYLFGRRLPTVTPVSEEEFEEAKILQTEKIPEPPVRPMAKDPPQEPKGPRDPRQRRQFDNGSDPSPGPGSHAGPIQQQQQQAAFFGAPFVQQQGFPPQFAAGQFGFPGTVNIDPRTAVANWQNQQAFPGQIPPAQISQAPLPLVPMQHPTVVTTEFDDEPLDCVLMKGLPRDATDRTIVTFLSDTGAVPARIHLMLDQNGSPSGDCFCEFRSPQEAKRAATKHGLNLDGCRVTVDLVPRGVVEEALEGPKQIEPHDGILGNGPPTFFENPRGGFAARGSFRGRGGLQRGGFERGSFSRGGFDQTRGGYRGRGGWSERGGRGGFDTGRGGFERGRGGRGFGRGRGGFENGRDQRPADDEPDPTLEGFGAPGCVVSMENVPFRATIDEIMDFFSGFELTQDDVIRRYNERGQPTGDARVAFRTPFDAQRAVQTRHMSQIHERRITLNVL